MIKPNIDKLIDINLAIKNNEMVEITGGMLDGKTGHRSKWIGTKMPKNIAEHETKQNEKFLDNNLSLIEDNLTPEQLQEFINYQNWNFKHGMGELTNRAAKNYIDSSDHWKEGLFNSCECKEKKQIEKTIRESMLLNTPFGNKWTNLIPNNTNFSYQTLATFSNAALNRGGGCEDATSEIGDWEDPAYGFGGGVIHWTGFGSGITGGVSANTNYNTMKTYFTAGEEMGTNVWACMYDSDSTRVGDGTATATKALNTTITWAAGAALDVLCTGDDTIRAGLGNYTGLLTQRTDKAGATSFADSSWGGSPMNSSFTTRTGDNYLCRGWKFSFV